MKNFIILLSVIILVLTGCGKSGDNKNEEVVLDINSTEDASTASKEITAEHTTVVKENQTTKANVDSETATTTNQAQTSIEESGEVTTVSKTEQSTEESPQTEKTIEVQTQYQSEQQTEQSKEQPTKATEPVTTATKYDIESLEYQNEIKRLTIYYINQYRESEGHVALTEDVKASEFAQARSVQLLTNFAHDVSATRALATEMKYGEYVDTKLYGMDGEPYYTPYGQEAIAKVFGNVYSSADDVAKSIAGGFYRSKEHWYYIGGTESVYETDTMCGIGISYKGGNWYCSMYVLEPQ